MIHSVFELGDTSSREVMVPRTEMVFVERDKTLRQAMSLALRSGFSRIPVIGENVDDIVGVVYLKDLVRRDLRAPRGRARASASRASCARRSWCPTASAPTSCCARCRPRASTSRWSSTSTAAPPGIVTIEDVLEEIVGEIADEYDTEAPEVEPLARRLPTGCTRACTSRTSPSSSASRSTATRRASTPSAACSPSASAGCRSRARASPCTGWDLTAESAAGRRNRIGTVLAEPVAPVDDDERGRATMTEPAGELLRRGRQARHAGPRRPRPRRRGRGRRGPRRDRPHLLRRHRRAAVAARSRRCALAVAQAAASGARGLEAAVVVRRDSALDAADLDAVRDLGGAGVPVHVVGHRRHACSRARHT